MQRTEEQMTPQQHAQRIAQMLLQAQQECRADIERVDDPRAQALFETIAEVLGGAMKALEHYQSGSEPAWQSSTGVQSERGRRAQPLPKDQRPPVHGPQPPVVTDMAVDIDENEPPPRLYTE